MRAIDTDATSTQTRAVSEAPSPWLALRVILTLAAAVLLLVGSFLEWANGIDGSELAVQSYWSTDAGTAGFFSSAGLVTAICGAVIILGLAFRGKLFDVGSFLERVELLRHLLWAFQRCVRRVGPEALEVRLAVGRSGWRVHLCPFSIRSLR